jgi:hypothetical protein
MRQAQAKRHEDFSLRSAYHIQSSGLQPWLMIHRNTGTRDDISRDLEWCEVFLLLRHSSSRSLPTKVVCTRLGVFEHSTAKRTPEAPKNGVEQGRHG